MLSFCNWIFIIHCKVMFPSLDWHEQHGRLLHVWLLEGFIMMTIMLCSVSKLRELSTWQKLHFQLNCKLHDILILNTFAHGIWPFEIIQEYEYFRTKKCLEKLLFLCFAVKEKFHWNFFATGLETNGSQLATD